MNHYLYETTFLYTGYNLYKLHQDIWKRVLKREGSEQRDFLYSFLEPDFHPGLMVTVRSNHIPESAPKRRLEIPQREGALPFSLRANVTQQDAHGKHRALFGHKRLVDWLNRQGERHGFSPHNLRTTQQSTLIRRKGRRPITLNDVLFSGALQITQPTLFNQAMELGLGRARGFGFGMLMLSHTTHSEQTQ